MKKLFSVFTFILTAITIATSVCAAPRDEAKPGEAYNIVYYEELIMKTREALPRC